jgi:transketolase
VGVGGGVAYGTLGPTHHSIEDIALMRVLPNMTVLTPGDPEETRLATRAAHAHDGPVYLRLGKNGEPAALPADTGFRIGRAVRLRDGGDVVVASTGCILPEALTAAETLAARGVEAAVLHYGTVKPFDSAALLAATEGTAGVVTVEEHSILAGFGAAAAETLAEAGAGVPLARVGLSDEFASAVGSREHLLAHYNLDAAAIVSAALGIVERGTRQAAPRPTMRREAA